ANPVLKQPDPATRRKLATASDASIPNIPDKPKVDRKGGADVEARRQDRDDPWSRSRIRGVSWVQLKDPWVKLKDPWGQASRIVVKLKDPWVNLPMEECNSMFVSNNELDIRKPSSVFSVVVADCKECTVGLIRMDPKWFEFSQKFHSFSDLYERAIVKLEFSDSGKEFKLSCVKDDGVMSIPATWKTDTFVSDKDNFVVSIEVRKGALSGESNMATVHQFIVKSSALSRARLSPKKGKVSQTVHEGVFGYASCAKGKADDVGFYLLPDSASPSTPASVAAPRRGRGDVFCCCLKATRLSGRALHTPPFRVLCHRMSSSSSAASSTAARIISRRRRGRAEAGSRDQATASLEVEEKRLAESGGGGGGEFLRQPALVGAVRHGRAHPGLPGRRESATISSCLAPNQLPELRVALAATSQAAVEALLPDRLWRIRHVKEALKAATEGSGRGRICALDCLKEADEKFGRRQLVEALQWLHERGSLIFLRHLSLIVTDPAAVVLRPARIAALRSAPGCWVVATRTSSRTLPHLRRILADSGALVPLAPLRRSAEDERLFYTNLYCAAGRRKALDWPLFTHAQLPAGSEPAAYRVYRGIVRPVERGPARPVRPDQPARPAVPLLSLRLCSQPLGRRDCRCSRHRAARMELAQTAGTESCTSRLGCLWPLPLAKMSSAQRASTRQLLWSALHLFTDALDALLLRQGCLGVQSSADGEKEESGEPENRSLTCRHSWDPASPEAGHAPSVCVLCGNCARAGPACRFNRIDSGIGGVARCLCEPAVRRACATCGVCADCVAAAWALHACVHPNRALPGSINLSTGGDGGSDLRRALSRRRLRLDDQGPAVELCPRLSLQSASKPEVTFCRNQLIAQDELIVCLKE
uniref:Calpain catalytic domain-containing protein n=1 Tax=Macrostomum lignano TaxID=282301 RepID=A0A1I8IV87_9PLAT